MEPILLLLLGVAVIYIIIQASQKKKNSTSKDNFTFQVGKEEEFEDYTPPKRKSKKTTSSTATKPKRAGHYADNPDIGPEDFMIWKSNEIPSEYLKPKKDLEDQSHFFYGKKVCISGQLDSFPYRAELAKHLWEVGADVDTGVGKTCEILIAGDGVGPSKLSKAEEQGVYIMDQKELHEKINGFKSKYI